MGNRAGSNPAVSSISFLFFASDEFTSFDSLLCHFLQALVYIIRHPIELIWITRGVEALVVVAHYLKIIHTSRYGRIISRKVPQKLSLFSCSSLLLVNIGSACSPRL